MSANPYYPVTTVSDSSQLADDDWGLTLRNVQKYPSSSGFKSLCQKAQTRPRCLIIGFIGVGLLLLLCIIIAVAASADDSPRKHPSEMWKAQTQGLTFYPIPEDKSIVISFVAHTFSKKESIKRTLDEATAPYDVTRQWNSPYTHCNDTYHPKDKTCRLARTKFGDECTVQHDYGYRNAFPCVFIQLDLPPGITIAPITSGSPLWGVAKAAMGEHTNPSYVPITCEGVEEVDRDMLEPKKGLDGAAIQYFPKDGFPAYFYRERNMSLPFTKPAVMVYFTSLLDLHLTHVRCTAWGQLYSASKLVDHKLLETEFAFYIKKDNSR